MLTAAERTAWANLCRGQDRYRTPFLHPGYTEAVAQFLPSIEVAVCEVNGEPAGFFPFERLASGVGRPVGGRISDYHGPVLAAGVEWDAPGLVRACGLSAWRFSQMPAGTPGFQRFEWATSDSPILDLSAGFERYCEDRQQSGTRLIREVQRKARKLERERGALRLEWAETSSEVFDRLLAWKAEQRRQTRSPNVLERRWAHATVEILNRTASDEFGGALSALYAGDWLVAAHFGLRTPTTLHWWFPAYDPEASPYSPGLILLLKLAEACAARGITQVDLGKGREMYKDKFSSGAVPLSEGAVDTRFLRAGVQRWWTVARDRLRSSWVHSPMSQAKARIRWLRYR